MKRDDTASLAEEETFDVHERETTPRAYPEIVKRVRRPARDAQATRRVPRADVDTALRRQSGMRPAIAEEDIRVDAAPASDAHERATFTAVPRSVIDAASMLDRPPPDPEVSIVGFTEIPLTPDEFSAEAQPSIRTDAADAVQPRPIAGLRRPVIALAVGLFLLILGIGVTLGRLSLRFF